MNQKTPTARELAGAIIDASRTAARIPAPNLAYFYTPPTPAIGVAVANALRAHAALVCYLDDIERFARGIPADPDAVAAMDGAAQDAADHAHLLIRELAVSQAEAAAGVAHAACDAYEATQAPLGSRSDDPQALKLAAASDAAAEAVYLVEDADFRP